MMSSSGKFIENCNLPRYFLQGRKRADDRDSPTDESKKNDPTKEIDDPAPAAAFFGHPKPGIFKKS
jgi:hypothetical protein